MHGSLERSDGRGCTARADSGDDAARMRLRTHSERESPLASTSFSAAAASASLSRAVKLARLPSVVSGLPLVMDTSIRKLAGSVYQQVITGILKS
jgi:hypothetical protein